MALKEEQQRKKSAVNNVTKQIKKLKKPIKEESKELKQKKT